MIKELWILVKMLFASKPSDILKMNTLEVVIMKHFPFKGYRYMCWCGKIVTRAEKKDVIHRFLNTSSGRYSLIHEGGHAMQAESEHGDNWLRYYLNYLWHWLKENPIINPASSAYFTNRYEVEAYAQERNPDYWRNYTRDNLRGKYTLKDGKKLYKEITGGKDSAKWKNFVKTL